MLLGHEFEDNWKYAAYQREIGPAKVCEERIQIFVGMMACVLFILIIIKSWTYDFSHP